MKPNYSFARSRALLMAGALSAVGGLAWAGTAFADSPAAHTKVSVKVDDKPIAAASLPPGLQSFSPIVKKVAPSVVKVFVTERAKSVAADDEDSPFNNPMFRQFFGDQFGGGNGRGNRNSQRMVPQQPQQAGLGSGVVISSDGYILTNNHVVHGADTIKVTLSDGRELTAKVVGTDPQSDLAVIKVEAKDLPAITFADSDKIEVGDRVLAIGNPFGLGETVTSGMVSGLDRASMGLDYEDFIQTDAAINPGNSGGALVDMNGRLIGINTAIFSKSGGSQGIGFAIPSNLAHTVTEQLATNGKVQRGYLGVRIQDVTPALAKEFGLNDTNSGALVAEVTPGSPAARSDLKDGDVIVKIEGKPVTDSRHLKFAVAEFAPGSKVNATILRDGKTKNIELKVGAVPSQNAVASNNDSTDKPDNNDTGTLNGVAVSDLDSQARREFDVPSRVHGAIVTQVDPASASAEAGLQPGDVIEEINHHSVHDANDAIKQTEKTGDKKTLVRVWNQNGSHYVVVDENNSHGNS